MKNLFDFLRRTWLLFFLLFIAPVIVIAVFAIKEYILHNIDLSAGEWANLLGCLFSYWGTILLGTLAFWQNDRVMKLEERNSEIQETVLKLNNTPDFIIDKVDLASEIFDTKELVLQEIIDPEYRQKYQSEIQISENTSHIILYILLKNFSNASAHNIEAYESVLCKEIKKHLWTMGPSLHKVVEKDGEIELCYFIHFDDVSPQNGAKFISYEFNLTYENIYHHRFYNHMLIFAGVTDNKLAIQTSIGEQYDGKKDLEAKTFINGKIKATDK